MSQLFLSHAEEDFDVVREIAEGLERAGYATWYHERDAKVGSWWLEQVGGAIDECSAFLLLVSPHTLADPYQVDTEVVMAFESRKKIYPVLVDVTHDEFKDQRRSWWLASRGAVSLPMLPEGVPALLPRIVDGLKQLKIEPELLGSVEETEKPVKGDVSAIRIYVSYRREDTLDHAHPLCEALIGRFGKASVFFDVDQAFGAWKANIEGAIRRADVFVAVIGKRWVEQAPGVRRLEDENDVVRCEIQCAFEHELAFVPVIVADAQMPDTSELPDVLAGITQYMAYPLLPKLWAESVQNIMDKVELAGQQRRERQRVGRVEVRDADITRLEVDAITSSANTELGGIVADLIARAGGQEIQRERVMNAPVRLGEVVETTAGEMPAKWVIHAATIPPSAEVIRAATSNTLKKADELGAKSLGLLAFGTGGGGFAFDQAAQIEVDEVRRHLAAGSGVERIVFAVRGDEARVAFERAVAQAGL